MTRDFLRTTTAIALAFSLIAPGATFAGGATVFAPGAFQVAQADAVNKGKAKGKEEKQAKEAPCKDGSEPPCKPEEKAEEATGEAVTEEVKPAEAAPAEEKPAEAATAEDKPAEAGVKEKPADAVTAEEKPAEAATDEQKPVESATDEQKPAETETAGAAEDKAPAAAQEEKPGKRKGEREKEKAEEAQQKEAETTAAPAAEQKPAETTAETKPVVTEEQRKTEEAAPATAAHDEKPAAATAEAPKPVDEPAAATAENAAPVEVTSETVTEETTRTSDEEVPVAKTESGKKKDDDLVKILGAAAGGVVAGVLLNEAFGGGKVVESTGDRVIIERDGEYVVRKDENEILRRPGSTVRNETFRDGSSRTVVDRPNGVQVVTIRDADGYVVRRSRIMPDGEEILLFDDTRDVRESRRVRIAEDDYPRYRSTVPHRRYVDYGEADRRALRDVLETRPIAEFNRSYSLRQVREDERVREAMPRLDLDVLTFDTGSAAISPRQARNLDALGWAMRDFIRENPDEVFLIEGHTDAVGSRYLNLILSDRRAEAVALALTEYYDIPPENLITQGYGEEFLKIPTDGPERANRRAAVRRITPLLDRTAARR